jgi:hypothetical protein
MDGGSDGYGLIPWIKTTFLAPEFTYASPQTVDRPLPGNSAHTLTIMP